MSFVPGTHFYRQKTKYTKPAPNPVPTITNYSVPDPIVRGFEPLLRLTWRKKKTSSRGGLVIGGIMSNNNRKPKTINQHERQRLRGQLGPQHPLSRVIKLGLRHPTSPEKCLGHNLHEHCWEGTVGLSYPAWRAPRCLSYPGARRR